MKINNIFSIFSPKDTKFTPLLEILGEILVDASVFSVKAFVSDDEEKRKEMYGLLKTEESKGDKISGQIFTLLNETFITPFDREDIHALADMMDDAIDAINSTAQKAQMYSPKKFTNDISKLAILVNEGAKEVHLAMKELPKIKSNNDEMRKHLREIKRIEKEADIVYEEAIVTLFNNETNATELIKLKEIIQGLEKSANKINGVRKVLKTILVKYS